jgi:hypothetical protein
MRDAVTSLTAGVRLRPRRWMEVRAAARGVAHRLMPDATQMPLNASDG